MGEQAKDSAINEANRRDGFPVAVEGARRRLPVVTTSSLRTYRRCNREYLYEYVQGYRPVVTDEALRFGTLIHHGLEAWWKADRGSALEAAIEALRPLAADEFDIVRAGVMLQGYDARWGDQPMIVLGVESEFRSPLVNPQSGHPSRTFELAGKLDVVVVHEGVTKLIEHKTSGDDVSAGSDYWRMLQIDPQVSDYFVGAKSLGHDVAECIYDVLGKPGLRQSAVPITDERGFKVVLDAQGKRVTTAQGKWRQTGDTAQGYVLQTRPETADEFRKRLTEHVAENPDRYYVRGTVVRLEREERDAAFDAWQTARAIRESELADSWPRNAGSCRRYSRMCSFFDCCAGVASLEDAARFRKLDNLHPELSEVAA